MLSVDEVDTYQVIEQKKMMVITKDDQVPQRGKAADKRRAG